MYEKRETKVRVHGQLFRTMENQLEKTGEDEMDDDDDRNVLDF